MSHQVQIDYEAIAIRCESICEVAEKQIAELDQILSDIENGSQSLHNSRTAALQHLYLCPAKRLDDPSECSVSIDLQDY